MITDIPVNINRIQDALHKQSISCDSENHIPKKAKISHKKFWFIVTFSKNFANDSFISSHYYSTTLSFSKSYPTIASAYSDQPSAVLYASRDSYGT